MRSFHGLSSFYGRFVKDFSSIATPLNELVKKNVVLSGDDVHDQAFKTLKDMLTNAPMLSLPNFDKAFEIECDASGIGIGAILMQDSKPILILVKSSVGIIELSYLQQGALCNCENSSNLAALSMAKGIHSSFLSQELEVFEDPRGSLIKDMLSG